MKINFYPKFYILVILFVGSKSLDNFIEFGWLVPIICIHTIFIPALFYSRSKFVYHHWDIVYKPTNLNSIIVYTYQSQQ